MRPRCETCLAEQTFDLIVCDFLVPAVNLPGELPCPAVLFTHNVESEIWRRHTETKTGALARLLYGMQYRRMLRFEARTLRRFEGVLAVSDADRDTFARLYPGAVRHPAYVVATGVDTEYFTPEASRPGSRDLVFTGSMDWLPNEDAMLYFCRDILPLIRAAEPDVTLSIVGRSPTPAVTSPGRRRRNRRDRARRRCAARSCATRRRLHRAASHWRRHAPEDFRSDGHGQGGRVDHRRR